MAKELMDIEMDDEASMGPAGTIWTQSTDETASITHSTANISLVPSKQRENNGPFIDDNTCQDMSLAMISSQFQDVKISKIVHLLNLYQGDADKVFIYLRNEKELKSMEMNDIMNTIPPLPDTNNNNFDDEKEVNNNNNNNIDNDYQIKAMIQNQNENNKLKLAAPNPNSSLKIEHSPNSVGRLHNVFGGITYIQSAANTKHSGNGAPPPFNLDLSTSSSAVFSCMECYQELGSVVDVKSRRICLNNALSHTTKFAHKNQQSMFIQNNLIRKVYNIKKQFDQQLMKRDWNNFIKSLN